MTILKLGQFGPTLTGREFGKSSYLELLKTSPNKPVVLDFRGVASLGSSFADEVVTPFAQGQENRIVVLNVNEVIQSCLRDVRDEMGIQIILGSQGTESSIREDGIL